jgi:hypothetical protein
MTLPNPNCVVKVGAGRGFIVVRRVRVPSCKIPAISVIVNGEKVRVPAGRFPATVFRERLIVTVAHCLPHIPDAYPSYVDSKERNYKGLLGALDGSKKEVWAFCRFVDPIKDVAILGSCDSQELPDRADAYAALTDDAAFLQIGQPKSGTGWVLTLDGKWVRSDITANFGIGGVALTNDLSDAGRSGSPILDRFARAIGLISTGSVTEKNASYKPDHGPHPILVRNLPGWMLTR